MFNSSQNQYMKAALECAKKSSEDIPVGCVIVKDGEMIASAHNLKEKNLDVSAHAEILALKEASKKLNTWRLVECDLYVTLEPCPMCAWAILNSRIKNVYFGSYDLNYGAFGSKINLRELSNAKINIYGGILENECDNVIKEYFLRLRK